MTIGWIDGTAGASGDMLLGALVDVGVSIEVIRSAVDSLGELGISLTTESTHRAGLAATKLHVAADEPRAVRRIADIEALLMPLDAQVRARAISVFRRVAEAEAAVHGTTVDEIHFHEVGALDSIADIVGVCAGFAHLGLDALHCSTLSLGSGTTRGEHGPIPVPAPAVLRLLGGIAPVVAGPASYEATTPTGAALLAEFVVEWGPMPEMTVERVAMGAGSKDTDAVANVCRLVVGEPLSVDASGSVMVQLDANVDDLDPRVWPEAIAAALDAGAVDAWVTPIVMKKGRPAHTFSALCRPDAVDAVEESIFLQTTTIGLRRHRVERSILDRTESSVVVDGHPISVKTSTRAGEVVNRSVEWDDVVAAARALGLPPTVVADRAARLSVTAGSSATSRTDRNPT